MLTSKKERAKDGIDAKKREIESMEIHGVYECVPDINQKCISTKWIIMEKFKDKKKIIKVHLVARGYKENSHNLKTDSPTCSCEAMRIVMLKASVMKWQGRESGFVDFTPVFLQTE